MNKTIKFGILKNQKSYINEINTVIKKRLKEKEYEIKYVLVTEPVRGKRLSLIEKGEYDLIVDNFFINKKRMNKVNFTTPIGTIVPRIIYYPDTEKSSTTTYLYYLYKILRKPFLYLFIFSLIIAIILKIGYGNKKYGILESFYHSIAGFVGQTGGILSDGDKHLNNILKIFMTILCFFVIYIFTLYIQASTTAKSVYFFEGSNKLERNILGERILMDQSYSNIKDNPLAKLVSENGAEIFPLPKNYKEEENIFEYYIANKKKLNLSGLITYPLSSHNGSHEKLEALANKYNLRKSKLLIGSFKIAIPVNKKRKKLLDDLNYIIQDLDDDGTLFNICKKFSDSDNILC